MHNLLIDTGNIIREARKAKGMTQQGLAEAVNTTKRTIVSIEGNETKASHVLILGIIRALDVSADHVFWPDRVFYTPELEQLIRAIQAFTGEEQAVFMEVAWAYVRSLQAQKSAKK